MLDPNAVLPDENISWRFGTVPDYTAADERKSVDHKEGSLGFLVNQLVKNWEKEASYKVKGRKWRAIVPEKYSFSCNGGEVYSVDGILRLDTYNALMGETAYYFSKDTGFSSKNACGDRVTGVEGEVLHAVEIVGGKSWVLSEGNVEQRYPQFWHVLRRKTCRALA
ncbi:MAG: hypothetical protein FRX49_04280 [Trebouxia sp. A1-2]|nr:MAG: hypothetical protein FRX49_04280 [Trebouxia sp. A1-2]